MAKGLTIMVYDSNGEREGLQTRLIKTFSSLATTSQDDASEMFMAITSEYVLYIVYLFIGRIILAYIAILGFRITSLRISANIRLCYLEALFAQPISTLDALPPGQTTAIITITANILQLGISERLSSLIQAVAVMIIALIIGCVFSSELMLVSATGLIAITAWYAIITPQVVRRYSRVQEMGREAAGTASEALSNVKMIAACGAEAKTVHKYSELVDLMKSVSQTLSPFLAVQHSPVFFTTFATFALCFWFAVKLYLRSAFANVETLVVVLMSVMTMLAHISAVSVPLTAASNAINAASIFFTIIDAPKPSTAGVQDDAVSINTDIVFKHVNFSYPSRHDVKILQDLSLRIPAGKTTAIVGPSGSGKSTTVALIQRWYELGSTDPISSFLRNGTIEIGDKNLHEIDLQWWRSRIGFVQQEPFLFNDTIFKNVEYGLVGTRWEDAPPKLKKRMVIQACKEAYAHDFIHALPEGYSTFVGERGLHFSGGQRQRIAIARAIVRRPQIMIFDEATSALDVASERIVQAALDRVAQNRTTIIIAHRLATVKDADHIVVLAKGTVVQQGTHKELLKEEHGAYWKLVNAQHLSTDCKIKNPPKIIPKSTVRLIKENRDSESVKRHSLPTEKPSYETLVESETTAVDEMERITSVTRPGVLQSFGTLLTEQRQNWISYVIMFLASMGAAASSPLQAYLFGRLISAFAYTEELLLSTTFLCSMLFVVAIGVGMSYFILGWVSNKVSFRTVTFYQKEYFQSMITKRISFFDEAGNSVGLLTAQLTADPVHLQQLLGINMAMVLISILGLIGCIIIAFLFHWKFALVVIVSSLPIILVGGWYRVRHEVRFEARNNKVFGESARFATEAIGAMRTVASLTLERTMCEKYQRMLEEHIEKSWKEARLSCLAFAASDSLVLLCMAFALWYGGKLLAHAELQPFNFLVVYLAIIQGSLAAGQWLSFGPNFAQVSAAAGRIQTMRRSDTEDEGTVAARYLDTYRWRLPAAMLWNGADIKFENVWFTYPTRDVPVLQGLSLNIRHGQFAAIVGSSGSGKTTIISLLERFYEPHRGTISYNGESVASMPLRVLRKRMSIVAQEPYLFRGTIRENVLLGVQDHDVEEDRLHRVCQDAGIHDFIMSLPSGYNTDVGNCGVSLSGGQKQRISIARALIRDPTVLLLDEATSNLDSESEKEIQEVFERTGKGRTMIVVAHRLATIQRADVIFVMDQGRVVEQGDHNSLLCSKGFYWQMCQGQEMGV